MFWSIPAISTNPDTPKRSKCLRSLAFPLAFSKHGNKGLNVFVFFSLTATVQTSHREINYWDWKKGRTVMAKESLFLEMFLTWAKVQVLALGPHPRHLPAFPSGPPHLLTKWRKQRVIKPRPARVLGLLSRQIRDKPTFILNDAFHYFLDGVLIQLVILVWNEKTWNVTSTSLTTGLAADQPKWGKLTECFCKRRGTWETFLLNSFNNSLAD